MVMKNRNLFLLIASFILIVTLLPLLPLRAQEQARLAVSKHGTSKFDIVVRRQFHAQYGLGFPITYRFIVSPHKPGLVVRKRTMARESWEKLPDAGTMGFCNSEEMTRVDRSTGEVYVSAAFGESDTLSLWLSDSLDTDVSATYAGITKYYDNRRAAVTVSADDWFDEYTPQFRELLELFRSFDLYSTVGVTTGYVSPSTWSVIQEYLDRRCIEVASHSRSHPLAPYGDGEGEVTGSMQDILAHLHLPKPYSVNGNQHVYVWIAPSGDYDAAVDSLVTRAGYLVPRLYLNLPATSRRQFTFGNAGFSAWNPVSGHFDPLYATVEWGAPDWGGGDTNATSLNALFDSAVEQGGVYHAMWHPQVLFDDRDKPYLREHLAHISRRSDLWYVGLGPVYLYRLVQEANGAAECVHLTDIDHLADAIVIPHGDPLFANGYTPIQFEVPRRKFVNLTVYNAFSQKITTLVNASLDKGVYEVCFDAGSLCAHTLTFVFAAGDRVRILVD